jgi:hypothetical protein
MTGPIPRLLSKLLLFVIKRRHGPKPINQGEGAHHHDEEPLLLQFVMCSWCLVVTKVKTDVII